MRDLQQTLLYGGDVINGSSNGDRAAVAHRKLRSSVTELYRAGSEWRA